jgi:hypothetical protein
VAVWVLNLKVVEVKVIECVMRNFTKKPLMNVTNGLRDKVNFCE